MYRVVFEFHTLDKCVCSRNGSGMGCPIIKETNENDWRSSYVERHTSQSEGAGMCECVCVRVRLSMNEWLNVQVYETIEILMRCMSFKWIFVGCLSMSSDCECAAHYIRCCVSYVGCAGCRCAIAVAKIFTCLNYFSRAHLLFRLPMPIQ